MDKIKILPSVLVILGILAVGLKLLGVPPVAHWPWLVVILPFLLLAFPQVFSYMMVLIVAITTGIQMLFRRRP